MSRLLLIVTDTFLLKGFLLDVVPGVRELPGELLRIGDPLRLKRPDGSELATTIGDLAMPNPNPRYEVLLALKDLAKTDVPVGTEIWTVDHPGDSGWVTAK